MFNLVMSSRPWNASRDTFGRGRVLEYTDDDLKAQFMPNGVLDLAAVARLPTILANETIHDQSQAPARVAMLSRVRLVAADYHFEYVLDPEVPPIPNAKLLEMAPELGITPGQFSRNHWSIKDADLYRTLFKEGLGRRLHPKVFTLTDDPVDESLVAVMMPFDAKFAPVYKALQSAVIGLGMTCQRGDDIWEHDHIIQDVVSLIGRAKVVICDLTGRNANVFYETGIAHTLGRDVILIAQTAADVPFDVAAIRYIAYLSNRQGLTALAADVTRRLETLRTRR